MADTPHTLFQQLLSECKDNPHDFVDMYMSAQADLSTALAGIECATRVEDMLRKRIAELERALADATYAAMKEKDE